MLAPHVYAVSCACRSMWREGYWQNPYLVFQRLNHRLSLDWKMSWPIWWKTDYSVLPFLPPTNEVCEGYVFTPVCHSVHGGGGSASVNDGIATPPSSPPPGADPPLGADTLDLLDLLECILVVHKSLFITTLQYYRMSWDVQVTWNRCFCFSE